MLPVCQCRQGETRLRRFTGRLRRAWRRRRWGALATGLATASKAVNEAGADGLLFGNAAQFTNQLIGVAASILFAAVMTFVIIKIMGLVMDLRAHRQNLFHQSAERLQLLLGDGEILARLIRMLEHSVVQQGVGVGIRID